MHLFVFLPGHGNEGFFEVRLDFVELANHVSVFSRIRGPDKFVASFVTCQPPGHFQPERLDAPRRVQDLVA
jgi:hypothetical protein